MTIKQLLKGYFPITIVILLFLLMRLPGLGRDISNSDAFRWYHRSEKFAQAIKTLDFQSTYQHYQPGVTLMWISSAVNFTTHFFMIGQTRQQNTLENSDWYPILHGFTKSSLTVILGIVLLFQVMVIGKLFNSKISIIYGLFVATEPYLIGIDRWFHVTSLEASLAFLSLLLLMLWYRLGLRKYLIFSSVALSLAVLSKIISIIVLPFFIALIVYKERRLSLKKSLIYVSVFVLVTLLFFPALWIAPLYVFNKLFTAAFTATVETNRLTGFGIFYYLIILCFKLSPITLFLFIFSLGKLSRRLQTSDVVIPTTYLLIYLGFLSLASQKIDRYVISVIYPLLLLTSVYVAELKIKKLLIVCFGVIIFTLWIVKTYYPVYSAYYSPIFGGSSKALEISIYDNSGAYFAQAAEYLNTKGRDIDVFIPDSMDSFSPYFGGRFSKWYSPETDYIVKSQDFDRKIDSDELCPIIDKTFGPGNFKAVYVFKCAH